MLRATCTVHSAPSRHVVHTQPSGFAKICKQRPHRHAHPPRAAMATVVPAQVPACRSSSTSALLMLLLLLATTASASQPPLEGLGRVTSVKGLSQVMYRDMRGWGGAYKLLNATGAVGSQGDQNDLLYIDAPLVHVDQLAATAPSRDVVVLVPVAQSVAFFKALLSDPALQARVKGVLVDDTEPPASYSTLGPFPGAEYAPYAQRDYVWNVAAGGNAFPSALTWLPAPTFLLTPSMAADAASRAAYNAQGSPKQQQYHARLKLTMAAGEASNSSACLAAGSCKPLGGFSVWAAMPPLPSPAPAPAAAAAAAAGTTAAGGVDRWPIILVVAQMDSIDTFHDAVQGANAPLSGLVAVLAALSQLKAAAAAGGGSSSSYSSRLVFLALAGEQWGYMGSRRLLYEAATGSNATAGLDLSLVEQVIEVGQVGQLLPGSGSAGGATLFAHRQRQPGFGDAGGMVAALSAAAQGEAAVAQVVVQEASASNPGIPPSSLMSLLRVNASIQGLVLTEFDRGFSNPFFGSRFDNGSRVDAGSISSAAAVLAAGLHRLAGGDPALLQVNMTATRSLVDELLSCLVLPVPGFACPLAASLMTADYLSTADGRRTYAPRNYIGVLQYLPEAQSPVGKANLARFVWNFMANATSADAEGGQAGEACDLLSTPCTGAGQVCMGWRASSKKDASLLGRCVTASVRYVPSYSTAIACSACDDPWQCTWAPSAAADAWSNQHAWPRDPAWAESDWPLGVPDLQLYLHESPAVERGVLLAGLLATAVAAGASQAARLAMARHHAAAAGSWVG